MNPQLFPRPKLVVFDLDNTFYEYDSAHEFAFSTLLSELQAISGLPKITALEIYENARAKVKIRLASTASSHSRLLYLSEFFSLLNLELNILELLRIEDIYWDSFLFRMRLFPDSTNFVEKLLTLGIDCALVTDLTSKIQYKKLEKLKLVNKFKFIITSEEAGGDKSTDLPWKLLDERAELSQYSTIWYVGDSNFDLNPTMRRPTDIGLLKTNNGPFRRSGDLYTFSSFAELVNLVN